MSNKLVKNPDTPRYHYLVEVVSDPTDSEENSDKHGQNIEQAYDRIQEECIDRGLNPINTNHTAVGFQLTKTEEGGVRLPIPWQTVTIVVTAMSAEDFERMRMRQKLAQSGATPFNAGGRA